MERKTWRLKSLVTHHISRFTIYYILRVLPKSFQCPSVSSRRLVLKIPVGVVMPSISVTISSVTAS